MPRLGWADCLRIALWFVGEEGFHPSERLLTEIPFSDGAIRGALAELKRLNSRHAANMGTATVDFPRTDLVRALRLIRRFNLPELLMGRIRSLLREVLALRRSVALCTSLTNFLKTSDLFHDRKAWRAFQETMVQFLAADSDSSLRAILIKAGRAAAILQSWYSLQDQLKRDPITQGALPLVWKVDRKRLYRLQHAIKVYIQCTGDRLPSRDGFLLRQSTETLVELDLPRPHWAKLRNAAAGCLHMLRAVEPQRDGEPNDPELDRIRALFERTVAHLRRFYVPETDADIATTFDLLNTIDAELSAYLGDADDPEGSAAVRAQLADCLEVAGEFLCAMPATASLTAIRDNLTKARSSASALGATEVCGLLDELHEAYRDLITACRRQAEVPARAAADRVQTLSSEIRESTEDDELRRLCDSIAHLLDPLAQYRQVYNRLKRLRPLPRADLFASLSECLNSLLQSLQQRTLAKIRRVEHRAAQLLSLALAPEPVECLLEALAEFREAASRDVVKALRNYGDDICDWPAAYQPAFDAAQFLPPTGDDLCEVREALAKLGPAEIVERMNNARPEQPIAELTLRLLAGLAEYEAGLRAVGVFLREYTKVVGFLESGNDPASGPGEFERFRAWLGHQQSYYPAPRLSPLPYADFAAWLAVLPVSRQADVFRVMFIGPWSDAIDPRVQQLIEEKPSIFTSGGDQRPNEAAKCRAWLFLIYAMARCRPFWVFRQLLDTICPLYYRRILPLGPNILENMHQAIERGYLAWASACAAGAPGMPPAFTIGMEIASAWRYLLAHDKLSKQVADGPLRRRSRKFIAAQEAIENAFAGPAYDVVETLSPDLYQDLAESLAGQVPRIRRFFGGARCGGWVKLLIQDILNAANCAPAIPQDEVMSAEEKRKKRNESRRRHSRIRAEERIFLRRLKGVVDRLRAALAGADAHDPILWAQYGRLRRTLSIYCWRERTVAELRLEKKHHSKGLSLTEIQVLERGIEKTYSRLYRLADEIAASCPILSDYAHGAGLPDAAEWLERAGRATVDFVRGFVRGPRRRRPGDTKRDGDVDSRPRGLAYLILRKWLDDDDDLLEELLEPPR